MDLVKISAVGGVTLTAMLALAATVRPSAAQSPFGELPAGPPGDVQRRIDDAFRPVDRMSVFALSGPLAPAQPSAVPVLPSAPPLARWTLPLGTPSAWASFIDEASRRFGVPAEWVRGVMQVESGGRAVLNGRPITSSAGAMGLMQVMPATFGELSARYGLGSNPYDPRANILAGTAYLREMYDRYGPVHFLAAYNAGPARVDAHLRDGTPLPVETQRYTATLLPRLIPGAKPASASSASPVQDLTSAAAIQALTHPSSRPSSGQPSDPATAPVFARAATFESTSGQRREVRSHDTVFITLQAADRRREVSALDTGEE